ncbi:MAG TPA: lysylphosphatidylglycerol synthase transmembrane domain-containing protein [bacterium]|nr:lysylphosphatidylglycerol synthase transmembrane domain-containing protein [bacterium]
MKKFLSPLLKVAVSAGFFLLVLRKVDLKPAMAVLHSACLPLVAISYLAILSLTFLLAWRWYLLLKGARQDIFPFSLIWQMTMVGLFFNMFLPTGAGGDLAKVFYLVRGQEKKLLLGSSVVVDRFIGALTVLTMAVGAILFTRGLEKRVVSVVGAVFLLCCLALALLVNYNLAVKVSRVIDRILPTGFSQRLKQLYQAAFAYCSRGKTLLAAIGVSFLLQIISIAAQYLLARAILPGQLPGLSLISFFVYVPLIWVATMIPSLGGLGVREFSYVFFFSPYFGREKAFALSLLVLVSVLLQSFSGAIVFLIVRVPQVSRSEKRRL